MADSVTEVPSPHYENWDLEWNRSYKAAEKKQLMTGLHVIRLMGRLLGVHSHLTTL